MFTISLKTNQYLTYILRDDEALSSLEVVPERGGIITRWKVQGQDILYLDEERFTNPQLSVRGGIPILFPICGNLPDNIFNYQGQTYTLKQHGFARDLPWTVTKEETDESARLTLVLSSNEQTLAVYPFEFELTFIYQLQGDELYIFQSIKNNSSDKMPFSAGFHPYFWTKDKSKLTFDIPGSQYYDHLSKQTHPFSGQFDLTQDEIDVAFKSITRSNAIVKDNERQFQITLIYSGLYSTLVFWTVKGKEYVCLEPWSAPRNALNTGEQLDYIEPGETYEAWVEMIYTPLSS
ncbi:Aldose 1-epimerase [Gloeothece citriformis PCC 7424]|uniref:Aldose 1-epimerase n=1 Tax=Gloeothece citriformis (strain PCC 7424) TaxID=65393 RepID=B7KHG8_GLOC7|nr:aldose 1-epimerase [Gloeothece citriformis]ACK70663.1 Aldose 1-epimerase [Gloeothece citriformis PCC 7424]